MRKNLLNKIIQFEGDIPSSYEFVDTILGDIGFRISFDPNNASDPLGSFTNILRNYRQKGLINPIQKDGRKLKLNGRNILQFLLIQRYLWLGNNLKRLQPISKLKDTVLQKLITAKEVDVRELPTPSKPASTPINRDLDKNKPWHHFKIRNGIMLQIQAEKYDQDQIKKIRNAVKESLEKVLDK